MIRVKRVYDAVAAEDGFRILVDRLWPRGVSKEQATLDSWLKEIAPSPGLRTWFDHGPAKFQEFTERYNQELVENPETAKLIQVIKHHSTTTLLYGAKDPDVNHARVLQKFLQHRDAGSRPAS